MALDSLTGAIDSATRSIEAGATAAKTLLSEGPASALSTLSDGLSSVGNFIKKLGGVKLPLPNPLFAYASYTYVIGLGCLTDQELNFPDKSYKAGKQIKLICKSANTDPSNRVNTPYGKFDFYIDNLVLDQMIGGELGTNNTNVQTFTFDIIEPYSMGMFPISCQQIAQSLGHDNWREAPFILTIDFRGNTETGKMVKIPKCSRQMPFNITDMTMTVTQEGARYHCSGMPFNLWALTDNSNLFKTDITTSGKTVQEILQSGENSLQSVLNARHKAAAKAANIKQPDEYLILFPQNTASESSPSQSSENTESKVPATVSQSNVASAEALYEQLGVTRSTINSNLIQDPAVCNNIGTVDLGFSETRKGAAPSGKDDKIYDSKTGIFDRSKLKSDVKLSEMKFSQDTSITTAINQVILQSNFVEGALDNSNITEEGYRGWFRIDTKVYNIGPVQNNTGIKPKLIVYRIVPYAVHASRLMPPNTRAPGLEKGGALERQAVKHYNYIYTGKNVDIIKFEIKFDNGFTTVMSADSLQRTQDKVTENQTGGAEKPTKQQDEDLKTVADGQQPSKRLGVTPTILRWVSTLTGQDRKGGGGQEGQAQRAAKLFQQALQNPVDMYNLDMTILGDPYYIAHSGTGNFTSASTQYGNLNADGSINYENGEVDIVVNFRTPVDLNQSTGMYDFGKSAKSAPVLQWSGIYSVTNLISKFSEGKFEQTLTGFRRPYQEGAGVATREQLFNVKQTTQEQK
jgi:hypothetical protein